MMLSADYLSFQGTSQDMKFWQTKSKGQKTLLLAVGFYLDECLLQKQKSNNY